MVHIKRNLDKEASDRTKKINEKLMNFNTQQFYTTQASLLHTPEQLTKQKYNARQNKLR